MPPKTPVQPLWRVVAWSSTALLGLVLPAGAVLLHAASVSASAYGGTAANPSAFPAILALCLMGAGMMTASVITAPAKTRVRSGMLAAIGSAFALMLLAFATRMPLAPGPVSLTAIASLSLAGLLAALSFAARGALFACSAGARGWWVALGVIAGEGAVVLSAFIDPGLWPRWLLALLPAQWANMAIGSALAGDFAIPSLAALGGTALATLFVVRLWPRRWTYGVMFSLWLGLSALVYHA